VRWQMLEGEAQVVKARGATLHCCSLSRRDESFSRQLATEFEDVSFLRRSGCL
jgi:hypothetical protein